MVNSDSPFDGYAKLDGELEKLIREKLNNPNRFNKSNEESLKEKQAVIYALQFLQKTGKFKDDNEMNYLNLNREGIRLNKFDLRAFAEAYKIALEYIENRGGLDYLKKKGLAL